MTSILIRFALAAVLCLAARSSAAAPALEQLNVKPAVGIALQSRYASIALGLSKARAAGYKSPKDLKGLKIGVTAPGSSTNFFVNALLAGEGLKPDDVAIIGVGASSNAVAAMKKGEIDGISNLDPVITKLERDRDIVIVADTRTAEGMKKYYG